MKHLFLLLFSLVSISIYSQIDGSETNATVIPAEENANGQENKVIENKPIENKGLLNSKAGINGLSVPEQNTNADFNTKKEFSMLGGEKFGDPGELYKGKVDQHLKNVRQQYDEERFFSRVERGGSKTDQFLGEFRTKAKSVNVVYRDHADPDGDRVRVVINGEVVKYDVTLTTSFSGFIYNLEDGVNQIDFIALNMGEAGPNTAELVVMDEEGNIIASSSWNLATGVKASIFIIREPF